MPGSNVTTPSRQRGGVARGQPATIRQNDDASTIRSLMRENESANTLASAGYDLEQRPSVPDIASKPDYKIEGKIFDCYAPETSTLVISLLK